MIFKCKTKVFIIRNGRHLINNCIFVSEAFVGLPVNKATLYNIVNITATNTTCFWRIKLWNWQDILLLVFLGDCLSWGEARLWYVQGDTAVLRSRRHGCVMVGETLLCWDREGTAVLRSGRHCCGAVGEALLYYVRRYPVVSRHGYVTASQLGDNEEPRHQERHGCHGALWSLLVHWWCLMVTAGDALIVSHGDCLWWADGALMVLLVTAGGALMVHWWCLMVTAGDALMVHHGDCWWCADGALMVPHGDCWLCGDGASSWLMTQRWRCTDGD